MIDHDIVRYGMVVAGLCGLAYLHKDRILSMFYVIPGISRPPMEPNSSPRNDPRAESAAPLPKTWIPRSAALAMLGRSSLVRLRVPADVTVLDALARHLGDTYKTPGEVRAEELKRKLLRDFETQHPNGIRDGEYGRELLEWWIEEQAFRTAHRPDGARG